LFRWLYHVNLLSKVSPRYFTSLEGLISCPSLFNLGMVPNFLLWVNMTISVLEGLIPNFFSLHQEMMRSTALCRSCTVVCPSFPRTITLRSSAYAWTSKPKSASIWSSSSVQSYLRFADRVLQIVENVRRAAHFSFLVICCPFTIFFQHGC